MKQFIASGDSRQFGCFYTTDLGYLMPTLVSALQLRQRTNSIAVDVVVIYFGTPSEFTKRATDFAAEHGIRFIIAGGSRSGRPMTFARFDINEFMDSHYNEIVYLDGDTQIIDEVGVYFRNELKSGMLMATPDPMALRIHENSKFWIMKREYFKSIGISIENQNTYFNAGVLRAAPSTWKDISKEALALYEKRTQEFKFLDQDILNIVAGSIVQTASLKWNFPAFLIKSPVETIVDPTIYHFMSNPRPWDGPFLPWGAEWFAPYQNFETAYPELHASARIITKRRYVKYIFQQKYKKYFERAGWISDSVLDRVRNIESLSPIDLRNLKVDEGSVDR